MIIFWFWQARSPEDTSSVCFKFDDLFLRQSVSGRAIVQTNEASKALFKSLNMEI